MAVSVLLTVSLFSFLLPIIQRDVFAEEQAIAGSEESSPGTTTLLSLDVSTILSSFTPSQESSTRGGTGDSHGEMAHEGASQKEESSRVTEVRPLDEGKLTTGAMTTLWLSQATGEDAALQGGLGSGTRSPQQQQQQHAAGSASAPMDGPVTESVGDSPGDLDNGEEEEWNEGLAGDIVRITHIGNVSDTTPSDSVIVESIHSNISTSATASNDANHSNGSQPISIASSTARPGSGFTADGGSSSGISSTGADSDESYYNIGESDSSYEESDESDSSYIDKGSESESDNSDSYSDDSAYDELLPLFVL